MFLSSWICCIVAKPLVNILLYRILMTYLLLILVILMHFIFQIGNLLAGLATL